MATVSVINAKKEKLFKLSDSERAEKVTQLLGVLDELEYLAGELKLFKAENKDQKEDAEKRWHRSGKILGCRNPIYRRRCCGRGWKKGSGHDLLSQIR